MWQRSKHTIQENLHGQVALITGASSGIGRATAHLLAADRATLSLAARREDVLNDLATELEDEYGVTVVATKTDLTDEDDSIVYSSER